MTARWPLTALVLGALGATASAGPCPADPDAGTAALSVLVPELSPLRFGAPEMAAWPRTERRIHRTVSAPDAATAATQQDSQYAGWTLRNVLERALVRDAAALRGLRTAVFEAVATDGYRAVFSWGELFNAPPAEQILVIAEADGRPLGPEVGPLALRALADSRPGPRHVRNLCALLVRPLPPR